MRLALPRYIGKGQGQDARPLGLAFSDATVSRRAAFWQKIQPRGWFVPRDSWETAKEIEDTTDTLYTFPFPFPFEGESKPSDAEDDSNVTNEGKGSTNEGGVSGSSRSEVQALRNKCVAVAPEYQGKSCPVCREKFDMFWSDTTMRSGCAEMRRSMKVLSIMLLVMPTRSR